MTVPDPPEQAPVQQQPDGAAQPALVPAAAHAREAARSAGERSRRARGRATARRPVEPAETDPVARVLVEVPLAHLDRPFDYLVPATMADAVRPGVRVKVRFAGQDVDGFVIERVAASDHPGRLQPLRRVVSDEPVLTPAVARLAELVAARYAGTRADVLRLAVPPRHATTERRPSTPAPASVVDPATAEKAWARYDGGPALVRHLADGGRPRAVWSALPGEDWPRLLAEAAAATVASGRGALLCVPDHRDVARLDEALATVLGPDRHVLLTADLGPAARYRSFLALSRGAVRVAVGTRAAAFAPVHDLGLVAVWDDGDDLHAEPRAPYPHTREVLLLRAHEEGAAAVVGGFARSAEGQLLVRTGWARAVAAPRSELRASAPRTSVTGATDSELARDPLARSARLPRSAFDAIRAGLQHGPVLVQTPRHGYAASLACERCRHPARCAACAGPLRLSAPQQPPSCTWCGQEHPGWACPECGGRGLRAPVRGDRRTAEEIGRAFPSVPVRTSSGDRVLDTVPDRPAIVVATPGAEPLAEHGYACVVLLDTWLLLTRVELRTSEEALRRWLNAAALARPAPEGQVVAGGDSTHPGHQALVRWDPAGHADRELAEREATHLPPASRVATLTGADEAVTELLAQVDLPEHTEVLGPVPVVGPGAATGEPGEAAVRLVLRVPRRDGHALSAALAEAQRVRSARKRPAVRVEVDPATLG